MKKFVTTALLAAFTATSIFAFTACGGNDSENENKEPVYTVTAEEWKTALNYFNVNIDYEGMPVVSDQTRINFGCEYKLVYKDENDTATETIKSAFDFNKNIMEVALNYEDYGHKTIYAWKDSNACYGIGIDGDGEYFKEETTDDEFAFCLVANICEYAGGRLINETDLVNKFSSFTYSEEKCEYTATIESPWDEGNCEVTVKMKDGKLISVLLAEADGGSAEFKYTYGNTLTVPDKYLKM